MPENKDIIAILNRDEDITAMLYPAQGIRAEIDTLYLYNPDAKGVKVIHDETLLGEGTTAQPLGLSDTVKEEIESKVTDVKVDGTSVVTNHIAEIDLTGKVDKTNVASKVYGTDAQGNQTTYDAAGFGQVDDVTVNGTSVVENKVAKVVVPTKTSDITNDSGFITKSVDDLDNYTKTSDLATVATSGSYNDLSNKPTIGDGTLTIQKNGTTVATFTANQTGNVTANIEADVQQQADWDESDTTAPDYIKNKPTKVSDFTNDAGYQNSSQVEAAIPVTDVRVNGSTVVSNKIASITLPSVIDNTSSESTTDALSANQGRVLQSEIESLQGRGRFLSVWNSATGLAETNPPTSPYQYHNGDYFIVGTVAESGGTNYKPNGSSYTTGVASTTVETETVAVNDTYLYDGTVWHLQQNAQRETTFANVAGSPYDNQNLATALNAKADSTDIGNATLTIQKNSTQVGTFTANSKTDATINITVPTTASDVGAVAANADITGATKCKITYDSKGLVTAGADLAVSDIPDLSATYQPLLTPGTNISITNNVISSTAQESFFRGKWNTWTNVPSDSSLYPADFHGNHIPLENDYMIVEDSSGYVEDFPINVAISTYGSGGWETFFLFTMDGETKDIRSGTVTFSNGVVVTVIGSSWSGRIIQINRNFKIGSTIYPKDTDYDLKGSVTSMKIASENPTVYEGVWRFSYHGVWTTNGKDGWKPEYQVEDVLPTADANTLGIAKLYTTTGNNTDGAIDQATITTALGEKQDVILDLDTIKSGASLGATALQPGDNISELNNDSGYTTNVGTVTSVNNVQPDANGNVTITIPSSDVTDVQIYGVSKVTSGVANLNVVEQVTSLPLSDVWMGRTVQYVGIDYPANDIYRGYYYIYETRPYGEHMSRTGWWQLDVQPGGAAVNDGTLTIQKNGTQVGTFTANQSTNSTINITVPTNTSDLTNNSGFITSSDIPVTDVTVGGTSVVTSGVAAVPAIPTVNDSTITLTQGGTTKGTFTLNQSSGSTIDLDAGQEIQVDASTMPDASTCPGRIVQWVGDTSSMTGLTKGYFYISGTHMVYNATITAEDWSPSYTSIIADFFVHKFKDVIGRNPEFDEDLETIYFLYNGSKWDLVDVFFGRTTTISDVTLSEYGVTVTGTPTNGSKLNIVPTVDFVSTWNRLNVQPDNGATVVYDAINEELTIS